MNIHHLFHILEVQSGLPASVRMLKLKLKKKKRNKIKVVFLCQLSQVWGCFESIYEAALKDPVIIPVIVALPEHWDNSTADTNAYDFLTSRGYKVINGYNSSTHKFIDLKALNADYIFYPRPYDNYLPKELQSREVSKFAKICYICYGYTSEGNYILKTCFSKYFISNCYMVFAENKSVADYCHYQLPISSRIGLHKICQTPFPRFDLLNKFKDAHGSGWTRPKEEINKRIIWTPRWTLEEKLGGTNFFNYKDFFFDFAGQHPENEFLFRPHPLAFDNFVKAGAMTEDDVIEYKNRCAASPNIKLDDEKEYLDNFASADILVSDMSGVVVDFAVTGKPVIFCSYDEVFNKSSSRLLDAYYLVHNATELKDTLTMLCNGEDPKKEIRRQIVKEVLGTCDGNNGKRIIGLLKKDLL